MKTDPQDSHMETSALTVYRRLWGAILVVNLFFAGLIAISLNLSKRQHEERALESASNLTHVLEQYMAGAIGKIDIAILELSDELLREDESKEEKNREILEHIENHVRRIRELEGLRFANAKGDIVYGASKETSVNVADRDYFKEARVQTSPALVVSEPIQSRVNGKWIMIFARKVVRSDGRFVGVVYATVLIDTIQNVLVSLDVGQEGIINFHDRNFKVIIRSSGKGGSQVLLGDLISDTHLMSMISNGVIQNKTDIVSPIDHIERTYSIKKISNYPLYLSVGMSKREYLRPWKNEVAKWGVILFLFVILSLVISRLIYEGWKKERKAEAELREAKNLAEKANQSKTHFLSNTSHELRTPLNSIIGLTDVLLESPLENEQREYVLGINRAGESLLDIINNTIELSRIESGRLMLEKSAFLIREMVEDTVALLQVKARKKDIALEMAIDRELQCYYFVGDKLKLRQILVNLVNNAIKFTPHGSVTVSVQPYQTKGMEHAVYFRVQDTGIGIPENKLATLFHRYTQLDNESNQRLEGSGLGLSICREFVELMGGEIWGTSILGEGTTFHFYVPSFERRSPIESRDKKQIKIEDAPPGRAIRILLADDSDENRKLLLLFLRHLPHTVDEVANGKEAFDRQKQQAYDLILMDVRMPIMDGLEATRLIRQYEKEQGRAPVPIIAMTALGLSEERSICLEAGCTHYLSKPIHKAAFLAEIYKISGASISST